jgi:hypothetical protein
MALAISCRFHSIFDKYTKRATISDEVVAFFLLRISVGLFFLKILDYRFLRLNRLKKTLTRLLLSAKTNIAMTGENAINASLRWYEGKL